MLQNSGDRAIDDLLRSLPQPLCPRFLKVLGNLVRYQNVSRGAWWCSRRRWAAEGSAQQAPTYQAVKAMADGEDTPLDFLLHVMRDEKHDIHLPIDGGQGCCSVHAPRLEERGAEWCRRRTAADHCELARSRGLGPSLRTFPCAASSGKPTQRGAMPKDLGSPAREHSACIHARFRRKHVERRRCVAYGGPSANLGKELPLGRGALRSFGQEPPKLLRL